MDLKSIIRNNTPTIIKLLKEKALSDFKSNLKYYSETEYPFEKYEYFEIVKEDIEGKKTFEVFGVNTKPHTIKTKIDLKFPESHKLIEIYDIFERLEFMF